MQSVCGAEWFRTALHFWGELDLYGGHRNIVFLIHLVSFWMFLPQVIRVLSSAFQRNQFSRFDFSNLNLQRSIVALSILIVRPFSVASI